MKKQLIAIFILYLLYIVYYYITRDNFTEELIQTTVVFGALTIILFGYHFLKRKYFSPTKN